MMVSFSRLIITGRREALLNNTISRDSNQILAYYNDLENFLYCAYPIFIDQDDVVQPDISLLNHMRTEVAKLEPDARFDAILRQTSFFHELRHFHDSLSTSMGIDRRIMLDEALFGMIEEITSARIHKPLRIPVAIWAKRDDCPEGYKRLVAHYSRYRDWFMKWYASEPYKVSDIEERLTISNDYPYIVTFK